MSSDPIRLQWHLNGVCIIEKMKVPQPYALPWHSISNQWIQSHRNPLKLCFSMKGGSLSLKDWTKTRLLRGSSIWRHPVNAGETSQSRKVKRDKKGSFWTLTYSGKTTIQENPGRHVETQTVHKVNNLLGAQTSTHTMPCEVLRLPLHCLLLLSVIGLSQACLEDPTSAYRFTGAVCRLTYPAAVVCKWEYLSTLGVFIFPPVTVTSVSKL